MDRNYAVRRVAQAVLTVWAVITITFGLTRLMPGDPRTFLMAMSSGQSNVEVPPEEYMDEAAIDPSGSLLEQYVDYLTLLAQGELGQSIHFDQPVAAILMDGVPWTVFLVATSLPLTFGIGIVLGAFMAYYEGTTFDKALSSLSTLLNSIPFYIAAVILLMLFAYEFPIFPNRGRSPAHVDPMLSPLVPNPEFVGGVLLHAVLPVVSIVITYFGFRALAMRGNSIQVLGEDFVRVARLRGLPDNRIAMQYVGRNAVLPIYTEFMIALGVVLGNTVVLEEIFAYQGLGYYFFRAIGARDYPLIMGAFLVITIAVVIGLFLADLSYGLIDPRASTGSRSGGSTGSRVPLHHRARQVARWVIRLPGRTARWIVDVLPGSGRPTPTADERRSPEPADDTLFETTASETPSRRERYRRAVDEYVLAPGRIIWSDSRARLGSIIILFYLLMGTVGVLVVPEPRTNQGELYLGAFQSAAHPLGTDAVGYDLLSLVVHSTPGMLEMMFAGALFATGIATIIGMLSAYVGGRLDNVLMFVSDVALAIPAIPLIMVLAVLFGPTEPWKVGILVTINAWGGTARQIRSQVLTIREESYVEASGIMSLSTGNILTKDILPNVIPFVFVRAADMARYVVVVGTALYFLAVLPFDRFNWGVILNSAFQAGAHFGLGFVHWLLVPCIAIIGIIYGVVLFAQGTDAVFNPRVRARHAERIQTEEESTPAPSGAAGDD